MTIFNHLASSNKPSIQAFGYDYDRYGNRWNQRVTVGSGPNPSYSFDANNRMVGYSYDAYGNVLNDGYHSYTYDAENRLVLVDTTAVNLRLRCGWQAHREVAK